MATDFTAKVDAPAPGDINSHCSAARISTMINALGRPQEPLTQDCQNSHASAKVKALLENRDVGPFKVQAIKPFLDVLGRVFQRVKAGNQELFDALGTAGALCVRHVRGSNVSISNHSWGTAIDISLKAPGGGHVLDLPLGDGRVQVGCLELYRFVRAEAAASGEHLFWGAGFSREDGMHFEASNELIKMWSAQGRLG